jgi:two-component system nitrate/nitrite response regulator NarL
MILIASPSKALCRSWREALAGAFPIHEIANKYALVHALSEFQPTVLFLDFDNNEFGTSSSFREIIQACPSTHVVIFTNDPNSKGAVTAIKAGAKGYGPKHLNASLIRKAARVISKGEIWIGRQFVSILIQELAENNSLKYKSSGHRPDNFLNTLSARQREIASLIAAGEPNKAISSHLSISEKTVKAHLTAIFRKVGVSGRTQLALFVSHTS